MSIKIILADDHRIFRDGLKMLLTEDKNFEVIAEASNSDQLLSLLRQFEPNVVILDISFPTVSGIELTKIIRDKYPNCYVLILSMHTGEDFILNSLRNGAKGYLPKDTSKNELFDAIYTVSEGQEFIGKQISSAILKNYLRKVNSSAIAGEANLTNRETDIIKLISKGLSTREIASELFISPKTVETHKTHILQKLNLKNSIELILYAIRNKIIEIE